MSYTEFFYKFAFTCKHLMDSPKGSPERAEWVRIKRELEMKRATSANAAH